MRDKTIMLMLSAGALVLAACLLGPVGLSELANGAAVFAVDGAGYDTDIYMVTMIVAIIGIIVLAAEALFYDRGA